MILSLARFKKTAVHLPLILKKYFIVFFLLHFINFAFNQTMIYFQTMRMQTHEDNYIPYMIAVALVGFFVQSAIKVIWMFVICHSFSTQTSSVGEYVTANLEKGIVESLRGFLKSVKWGFLFIIPGLIKAIRFQFTNFIVCTNKNYPLGQVDALEASQKLTERHVMGLIFAFLIFATISISTSTSHLFFDKPLSVGALELLSIVLFTFEVTYMYFVFSDLQSKGAA
jgi:hypothetical protein